MPTAGAARALYGFMRKKAREKLPDSKTSARFLRACNPELVVDEADFREEPPGERRLERLREEKDVLDAIVKILRGKSFDYIEGFLAGIDECPEQPFYLSRGADEIKDALCGIYAQRFDPLVERGKKGEA